MFEGDKCIKLNQNKAKNNNYLIQLWKQQNDKPAPFSQIINAEEI